VVKAAHHFFITICAASGSGGMEVKMEKLFQYIDIDYYQNNYPIFILNGKIVSSEGIPDIKEIENYIEEFA
jgi:disulfide oxidoreductase YuzD